MANLTRYAALRVHVLLSVLLSAHVYIHVLFRARVHVHFLACVQVLFRVRDLFCSFAFKSSSNPCPCSCQCRVCEMSRSHLTVLH